MITTDHYLISCSAIEDHGMSMSKSVIFETKFNHYTGTKIIGQGGAGRVYQATDDAGNVYAVKLLDVAKSNSEKMKRFKNEVEFCRRNQHQNIITVYDHGIFIDDKKHSPFYVMPLYKESLRTLLAAGILPEKVPVYFAQLLDGVEAAHLQKVIHRDLKPENVLYDEGRDRLLIADFGIARFEEEALYTAVETSPNARLANFQYAAPEQRSRGADVDHRADIYALGLMLNEMFTGKIPHGTEYKTISSVASDYSYLDEIVSAMLRQSAVERPGSIEEVKQELIGRKLKFVTRQRISELKQMVVPVTDLDDPLIIDPPRLVNFDYEPKQGVLFLILQRPINTKWIEAWHYMARYGTYTSFMNKGPERFSFSGDKASIPAREDEVQQTINYFKDWLPNANRVYEQTLRREMEEAEEQQRKQLQIERAIRQYGIPPTNQLLRTDLLNDRMLAFMGYAIRTHHCFSKEPFSKDQFKYVLEQAAREGGKSAVLAPKGNPGHDITIAGDRFSLKTQADNNLKAGEIHISKFMELGRGEWFLEKLRERFFEHMRSYERILVLRALSKAPKDWLYELVEIPKSLLEEARQGKLEIMEEGLQTPKPGYCRIYEKADTRVDLFNQVIRPKRRPVKFELYFDGGSERKLQVRKIKKQYCLVHATWGFPAVSFDDAL